MPSLPQALTVRPIVLWVPSPWLEDMDREQNEAAVIQGEIVSDLLHHFRHTQVYDARWDPPKGIEGAGGTPRNQMPFSTKKTDIVWLETV